MGDVRDDAKAEPMSPLVEHASNLEKELTRFERLVREAHGLDLASESGLQRAKTVLEECAGSERRMADELHGFVAAMQAVQARQRTCMEQTVEVADRVRARIATRNALLERFAALGELAGGVNEPVAQVMEGNVRGASASELATALGEVIARTNAIVDDAAQVAADARAAGWNDIAREAEALRTQVEAAREKVLDARRGLARDEPS